MAAAAVVGPATAPLSCGIRMGKIPAAVVVIAGCWRDPCCCVRGCMVTMGSWCCCGWRMTGVPAGAIRFKGGSPGVDDTGCCCIGSKGGMAPWESEPDAVAVVPRAFRLAFLRERGLYLFGDELARFSTLFIIAEA